VSGQVDGKQEAKKTAAALPQVELPSSITVKQLAEILKVEPVKIVKELMRKDIMASINQVIDFDIAATISTESGYKVRHKTEHRAARQHKKAVGAKLQTRPPVVTVMGHVDHGKTTLLDSIRKSNIAAREAGAITQHIGAYQVTVDGRKITFLDTPGHEAFTAMRAHGARATDLVVLLVAADDGVMPQSLEAISHAKAAKVPIIVAINKIDKPNANIERVKQQLADSGLVIEEWGGDVVCVPISAKNGKGIPDLLDNLFLVADILEIKADPNCPAEGVVIEAKLDKTKGPLATLLLQKGTLKLGDVVVAGNSWGKTKAMFDEKGKRVRKAEPSAAVQILGLNSVPSSGEVFTVVADEHQARSIVDKRNVTATHMPLSLSTFSSQVGDGRAKELDIVLKTDVQGSIEPIRTSIEQLGTEGARAKIIHAASGSITGSDVLLASASKGIIIGFNTSPAPGAPQLAEAEKVSIQYYDVIYKLIEDIDKTLKGMLEPTYAEIVTGRAQVRAIFTSGKGNVAGAYVTDGKIRRDAQARVLRRNKVIHESRVTSLRRFKDNVTEVAAGLECGLTIDGFPEFQVGDIIELYRKERTN
jgi:translation initiation factor IF-2